MITGPVLEDWTLRTFLTASMMSLIPSSTSSSVVAVESEKRRHERASLSDSPIAVRTCEGRGLAV